MSLSLLKARGALQFPLESEYPTQLAGVGAGPFVIIDMITDYLNFEVLALRDGLLTSVLQLVNE